MVSGHERSSQQTTSVPRKTQPHSQPTQQLPTSNSTKKGRMYTDFSQKPACIRDFYPKTCMYTRLLAKNLRMYATFGQKPTYTEKTVVKIRPRVKPIKGSVNGWTYYKMQHRNKDKQRASQEYQAHCAYKPQIKTRNVPSGVANSVTERISYGLGYHNRQLDSRNQSFPICKRNQISNTKGSKLIPYSGWLK